MNYDYLTQLVESHELKASIIEQAIRDRFPSFRVHQDNWSMRTLTGTNEGAMVTAHDPVSKKNLYVYALHSSSGRKIGIQPPMQNREPGIVRFVGQVTTLDELWAMVDPAFRVDISPRVEGTVT